MPKEKFNGLIFQTKIGQGKVFLVKPQTFMNNSGQCLRELLDYYKIPIEKLIVIYDDIDLPEGKLRLRANGGPGTHNGMRSIVAELKSEKFPRIRIGMGAPEKDKIDLADYVLGKIPKASEEIMKKTVTLAGDAAELFALEGIDKAMQKYNSVG